MENNNLNEHNNFEKDFYDKVFDNRIGYSSITHIELRKNFEKFIFKTGIKFNRVLEIGCGAGEFCEIISKYSNEVVGIDLSKNAIEMAIKLNNGNNIKFIHTNIEDFEDDNGFDLIILANVVCHVFDLDVLFNKIGKLLTKNGYLYIQNRNKNALTWKIQKLFGGNYINKAEKYQFDINDLKSICQKYGYNIIKYDAKILGPIEFSEKFNILFKIIFNLGSIFKPYGNYIYLLAKKNGK